MGQINHEMEVFLVPTSPLRCPDAIRLARIDYDLTDNSLVSVFPYVLHLNLHSRMPLTNLRVGIT